MKISTCETEKSYDAIYSKEKTLAQIDNDNEIFGTLSDTAILIMCPLLKESNIVMYDYIVSNERVLQYVLNGKVLDLKTKTTDDPIENPYDPKEIDEILDHIIIFGVHFYLVKWKNWSIGFNSWECFDDLCNSQQLLGDYLKNKTYDPNNLKEVNGMHIMLSRRFISKMFDLFQTKDGLALPCISTEDLSGLFDGLNIGSEARKIAFKRNLNSYLKLISLSSLRYFQLLDLHNWHIDISVISYDNYHIKVENNIDLEGAPNSFTYVSKYVPRKNDNKSNGPRIGCECNGNCDNSGKCCYELAGYSRPYDENKCIIVDPGCPVFECNDKCNCTDDCYNRVVQLGNAVNISIYKTEECGWGVKASEFIPKGKFVALVTGEIITIEESKNFLKKNALISEYMWTLDFDDSNHNEYIVDASNYGNISRFINHSCDSNLNVYKVWMNGLNSTLPKLALFTNKNISASEQLTVNYFSGILKNKIIKKTGIRCLCKKENCQGYYF